MCEVLHVSKSGYYRFLKRGVSAQETKRLVLLRAIEEIYRSSRNTYGSPRVYAQLKALGFSCSKSTVERLMRANGMVSKVRKKYKATTDATHAMPIAPNRVNQKFQVEAPNQLWMGDITYLRTEQGWFYLAVVLDAYSRKVVGFSMNERMQTNLVLDALEMAVKRRRPQQGLIFHSDRGSQYASESYRQTLCLYEMLQSMIGRGNGYDNAVVESFFHTLKAELDERFSFREQARRQVFVWMEGFYNRNHLHSSLGYKSPEQFENQRKFSSPRVHF